MKARQLSLLAVVAALAVGFSTTVLAGEKKEEKSKLEAEAKVSKADAEKTALAKVSGGTVKEAELEEEDGKLVWSFDIATADSKDITEIQVDAKSGEVVKVEKETPADQAKEKAEDAKKEKKGKKDKDDDEKEEKGEHKDKD